MKNSFAFFLFIFLAKTAFLQSDFEWEEPELYAKSNYEIYEFDAPESEKLLNQNMDSAFTSINQSLLQAIKQNDNKVEIINRRLLGLYYYKKGEIAFSITQLKHAIELAGKYSYTKLEAIAKLQLAEVYAFIGVNDKQFDLITQAAAVFEEQKDTFFLSYTYNNLGELYRRLRKGKDAYEYFKKSFVLAKESSNQTGMARACTNIGTSFLLRNKTDSAKIYLYTGLDLTAETQEVCKLLVRIGRTHNRAKEFLKAKETYQKAMSVSENTQNELWYGRSAFFLSKYYFYSPDKNLDSAFYYVNIALQYYEKNKDIILGRISLGHITDMYESLNNVDSTLKYYRLTEEILDSIEERKNVVEISNIKWQGEVNLKEQELAQLNTKKQILEQKQEAEQKARIWFWLGIIFLGALSTALYYAVKQKTNLFEKEKQLRSAERDKAINKEKLLQVEKEKNLAELEHKNNQLASISTQMFSKSEAMSNIKNSIDGLKKNHLKAKEIDKQSIAKELRQISMQLDNNMRMDEEWENLKLQFQEVHQDFYDKLKLKYESLTQYDLKLCTFIHLGFDTKQIAQMLNVNHESLRKQRYRMRKKMNIKTEQGLQEHIAEITC